MCCFAMFVCLFDLASFFLPHVPATSVYSSRMRTRARFSARARVITLISNRATPLDIIAIVRARVSGGLASACAAHCAWVLELVTGTVIVWWKCLEGRKKRAGTGMPLRIRTRYARSQQSCAQRSNSVRGAGLHEAVHVARS